MARFFAPLFIAAVGVTFVILLGEIDLSIGSTLSLASVLAALSMRATGSVWLGAAAGVGTGMVIGAINGAAVAKFRFPAFIHTLGMLLTVRAVGMLVTGGHSVGRLPPEVIGFGRGYLLGLPNLLWLALLSTSRQLSCWRERARPRILPDRHQSPGGGFNGLRVMRTRFGFSLSGALAGFAGVAVVLRLGSGGRSWATTCC